MHRFLRRSFRLLGQGICVSIIVLLCVRMHASMRMSSSVVGVSSESSRSGVGHLLGDPPGLHSRDRRDVRMHERLDPVSVAAALQRCTGQVEMYVLIRTKDSAAIIEEVVAYYLAHGAKQVYILDNSVDNSIKTVSALWISGLGRDYYLFIARLGHHSNLSV
jgi:hypothetical protein